MKLLDDYIGLKNKIFEYFGYKEDWCAIPLDDCREYWWHLTGEGRGDEVMFAAENDMESAMVALMNGSGYSNLIYTQRFLPKWVYRGEEYTMICVDTQTDGNKFLSIFDNKREIKSLQ